MQISTLSVGVQRVCHPERTAPFMLSVVDALGGIKGVAGYELDAKRPARGKHLMLSTNVRNWIEQLQPASGEVQP